MKGKVKSAMLGIALLGAASGALAQSEQFIPALSYRVGPYAAGGSGYFGGAIDYFNLVNLTGGINGVKLVWEECETEYNAARGVECYERLKTRHGGASTVEPLSTGIAYGLLDRVEKDKIPMTTFGYGSANAADGSVFKWVFPIGTTYWDQAAAMIAYIGQKAGGVDKLKGKKILHLYHDSAYGKEPIPVFEALAAKYGFEFMKIAVAHPGNTQQSQWLQIRQANPDFVILWGWGVMNPTAIKTAAKVGFPRDRIIGTWWAGSEEDVIPAGDAAKGYVSAAFSAGGTSFPVMQAIVNKVYGAGKGNLEDKSRIGSLYHTRGVSYGIIIVEAIRTAQAKFGKGKVMTPEQVRWGLENLNLTEARLKEIGAAGLFPPIKTSCADHEGSGMVRFQQWDGKEFKALTPFMIGDRALVNKMVHESAAKYAAEKKITPRDCAKEM
ncbi:MAG: ABC transporter substrate-binding protein [Burkholderiales bacterium]|jgi:branched-chain amino acid transport system substrate-binding protein|nr:ABC transporter substrate-binding protein [Burkholderiales bacterium]